MSKETREAIRDGLYTFVGLFIIAKLVEILMHFRGL